MGVGEWQAGLVGRREDRAAQERVGFAVMWWFVIGIAGFLFPPLWLLMLVPVGIWLVKREAGGGLGGPREWAEEARGRRAAESWSEMFGRPPGWYRHFEEKRHVARWWDGQRWTRHRFDRRAGVYLPLARPTGLEAQREALHEAVESERARMVGAPAGWYAHPREGRHVLRFWDGQAWSLHRWDSKHGQYLSPAAW